ncbi:MAG: roadblock/LC7 domain-containing protein [Xanthomonadales bacterium]|nr:roadblock/LC7 domain-containing protein [Xanthomonadales bacterium]
MPTRSTADVAAGRRLLAAPDFRGRCEKRLNHALSGQSDIDLLCLASVDGRAIACVQRTGANPARVAAMTATLMSVSESLSRELDGSGVEHALLSLRHGVVVSRRLGDRTGIFTLSALGRGTTNLALALRFTLDLADSLAADIEALIAMPAGIQVSPA